MIKIKRKSKRSSFKGNISLNYKDCTGQPFSQSYDLSYEFHPEEQFMSDEQLREALCGFAFVSELKTILEDSQNIERKEVFEKYSEMLLNLRQICPSKKKEVLENVIKTVEGFKPVEE